MDYLMRFLFLFRKKKRFDVCILLEKAAYMYSTYQMPCWHTWARGWKGKGDTPTLT